MSWIKPEYCVNPDMECDECTHFIISLKYHKIKSCDLIEEQPKQEKGEED